MQRWFARIGAAILAAGTALVTRITGTPLGRPLTYTVLALIVLWVATRLARLLKLPARVIAASLILIGVVAAIISSALGISSEGWRSAGPFFILATGIAMVMVSTAPQGWPSFHRVRVIVLDARRVRPAPRTGVLTVWAVFADCVVDLVGVDLGAGTLVVDVRAFASRTEVRVSRNFLGMVADITTAPDASAAPAGPEEAAIRVIRRAYLHSTAEIVFVSDEQLGARAVTEREQRASSSGLAKEAG